MKKGKLFKVVFCISYLFFQRCSAMMEEIDLSTGSLNASADEYTILVPGRESSLLEQQEKACLQKLKSRVCGWWREGDCGCCKLKRPGYCHAMFWGTIAGVAGIATLCVWYYGNYGSKCDDDNDC